MKRSVLIFLLAVMAVSFLAAEETDTRHLSVQAGLMVFNRQETADKLALWAEENGGYFTWKSDESVRLRVPDKAVDNLRDYLTGISDALLSYERSTIDLREDIIRSRSALEAKEEILAKNLALLESSNVQGTLALEREIRRLMQNIDFNRGMLRKMEHDAQMAMLDIYLSFNQQTVAQDRPSRFSWINSVDFYFFIDSYPWEGKMKPLFPSKPIPVPEGFARLEKAKEFNLISSEGVKLQIKTVDNYPEQNIDFWAATLQSDLENRGYLPMPLPETMDWGGGGVFHTFLWALPVGTEDYLYLTGIRLNSTGRKIEILEMAGKAEYVSGTLKSLKSIQAP